jgi:hypothetical protein
MDLLKEAFIEGYKQRAESSDLIFGNASRMYAISLFDKWKSEQLILSGVVASLPDEEMIYVSHGSDGDDDVYCAFTDLSKAEKDCEESGTSLSTISLYRK